jgi:hypothetical protein
MKEPGRNINPGCRKALSVPCKAGSKFLPARSGAAKLLAFKLSSLYAKHKAWKDELGRNLIIGHGKALSVPYKAGSALLPLSSGAGKPLPFKLSTLYAEHKARKVGARIEPHHPGRGKALSVHFKAGSELLPVSSGAAKLLSFEFSPLYAEHKARRTSSS